jgi:hypothetical protein
VGVRGWQGADICAHELRKLYQDVSRVGVTYSQMVARVNDVLYSGYTNVRPLSLQ